MIAANKYDNAPITRDAAQKAIMFGYTISFPGHNSDLGVKLQLY
jgi:hypothetical protein